MVSVLEDLRESIVDDLVAAGVKATDYLNEVLVPPVAVVVPGEPYITTDEVTFGHVNVNISVLLIASKGTNKAAASAIDSLIVDAMAALDGDWDVIDVARPGQVNVSGSTYLGSVITIQQEIRL